MNILSNVVWSKMGISFKVSECIFQLFPRSANCLIPRISCVHIKIARNLRNTKPLLKPLIWWSNYKNIKYQKFKGPHSLDNYIDIWSFIINKTFQLTMSTICFGIQSNVKTSLSSAFIGSFVWPFFSFKHRSNYIRASVQWILSLQVIVYVLNVALMSMLCTKHHCNKEIKKM